MLEDLDIEAALGEFAEKLPGLGDYLEPDHPGMHALVGAHHDVLDADD